MGNGTVCTQDKCTSANFKEKVMKVLRANGDKVFEGYVLAARKNKAGNLEIDILTFAKDTPYTVEFSGFDLREIRSFTSSFTEELL
jgi:hypothetical protein